MALLWTCEPKKKSIIKPKIEQKKAEIRIIEKKIEVEKVRYIPIKVKSSDLSDSIVIYKETHDTVKIVMFQDSLIDNQRIEIKQLETVIFLQDENIRKKDGVIEFQEIEIEDLTNQNKDLRKQIRKGKVKGVIIGVGGVVVGVVVGVLVAK